MDESFLFAVGCAVLAGALFGCMGLGYKMAERLECRSWPFTIVFGLTGVTLSAVKCVSETSTWEDPMLWILGLGVGVGLWMTIRVIHLANERGPASVNWTIVNLSLLVPIGAAPFLFSETLLPVDAISLLLFIVMLLLVGRGSRMSGEIKGALSIYLLFLVLMWAFNGSLLLASKYKQHVFGAANTGAYSLLMYAGCLLSAWIAHMVAGGGKIRPNEWKAGAFTGFCSGTGFLLSLVAMRLPAVVVFPMFTGLSLLTGVVLTCLIYREPFNKWKVAGLVAGLFVMVFSLFRTSIDSFL